MTAGFVAFVSAFCLSAAVVPIVRRIALRRGLLDIPNERSSHDTPTPRMGGLAILAGFALAAGMDIALHQPAAEIPRWQWTVVAAMGGGALVGVLDDLFSLRTALRMPLYLLLAGLVAGFGARVDRVLLPSLPALDLGPAPAIVLSALLVAWYLNLFNFMDGIDGIAGGAALVTHTAFGLVFLNGGAPLLASWAFACAGGAAGFLLHNFPPATVFMGDGGAVFLGLSAGAFTLASVERGLLSLPAAVLLMMPFVFDATFTLLRRVVAREPFWAAHRSHVYQQLCDLGWGHRPVTALYTVLAAICAAIGLCMDGWPDPLQAAVVAVVVLLMFAAAILVVSKNRSS